MTTSDEHGPYEYNLPETAICPGCETMVVLPVVVSEDGPLPICGTCGSEVPDPRIAAAAAAAAAPRPRPRRQLPPEHRKYTRGSLFGALRDTVADKGIAALNKRVPPNFRRLEREGPVGALSRHRRASLRAQLTCRQP